MIPLKPHNSVSDLKDNRSEDLPNAIEPKRVNLLVAKKRHMSGLMCPPMGYVCDEDLFSPKVGD
jgi:hypothetical protein